MESSSIDSPVLLRGGEISDYLSHIITKPAIALLVLFLATFVQTIRRGVSTRYILLLLGAVMAGVCLGAFALLIIIDSGRKRRSIAALISALGGFVPYLFGIYLVFYEGLWRLRTIFSEFSLITVLYSVLFVAGGFVLVEGIYRLSDFGLQVDRGQIVLDHGSASKRRKIPEA